MRENDLTDEHPTGEHSASAYLMAALATLLFGVALHTGDRHGHLLTTSLAACLCLLGFILISWKKRDVVLGKLQLRSIGAAALAGLALALFTYATFPIVARWFPEARSEVVRLYSLLNQHAGGPFTLPLLTLVVLAEEVVWRELLFRAIRRHHGSTTTVLASSICYSLPQLAAGSWVLPLVAFGCGLAWGTQRAVSKTVSAPIVSHWVWSTLIFVLLPLVPPA